MSSYLAQNEIAFDIYMVGRVAQAATTEKPEVNADEWTRENARIWAAAPGWDAAWQSARVAHPEPEYQPGKDEAVITDGMILSQLQSMP